MSVVLSILARQADKQAVATEKVLLADRTLVIGNLARWSAEGRATAAFDVYQYTEFAMLTRELLDRIDPAIILSPLVGDDFDVLEIATQLAKLGYKGRYRAITTDMPNAEMVRAEVRSHTPDLDFDLLVVPPIANDG